MRSRWGPITVTLAIVAALTAPLSAVHEASAMPARAPATFGASAVSVSNAVTASEPAALDWSALLSPILVAVIPLVVALMKKFIPPERKMAVVSIAVALGPLFDYVSTYVTAQAASPGRGLAIGLAAIGLRELVDRARKGMTVTLIEPPLRR